MTWDTARSWFDNLPAQGQTALTHVKTIDVKSFAMDAWAQYPGIVIIAGSLLLLVLFVLFVAVVHRSRKRNRNSKATIARLESANEALTTDNDGYKRQNVSLGTQLKAAEARASTAEAAKRTAEASKTTAENDAKQRIASAFEEHTKALSNEREMHRQELELLRKPNTTAAPAARPAPAPVQAPARKPSLEDTTRQSDNGTVGKIKDQAESCLQALSTQFHDEAKKHASTAASLADELVYTDARSTSELREEVARCIDALAEQSYGDAASHISNVSALADQLLGVNA